MADLGQYLQQQYDAGAGGVTLRNTDPWTWDTPFFQDKAEFGNKFTIDLGGARVPLSPNLPTVAAFEPDPTVRVAMFPNTNRSAWNRTTNTVEVSTATRTSGAPGVSLRATVKNGRLVGGAANVGVGIGNRCGALFENVVLSGGRFAWTWDDYGEPHVMRNCHFQTASASQVRDAFLMYGYSKGDGVIIEACKADGNVGIARLKGTFGASLRANITGDIRLDRCLGIVIDAGHQESGIGTTHSPTVRINGSVVLVNGGAWYPSRTEGGTFQIVDDPGLPSLLHLNTATWCVLPEHGNSSALVDATGATSGTVIQATALASRTAAAPGRWVPGPSALLLTQYGQHIMDNGGRWEVP